jgi:hypothetical protein
MANITAVKSGNWSDPTVWSSGALPTAADDVFANAFNVTIDQNVTVLSIRQSSPASGTVGGTFILSNGITVNATSGGFISRNNSFTGGFIRFTLNSPNSATLVGNINHAQGDAVFTVGHSGTGTLNIVGNFFPLGQAGSRNLVISSTGIVNITGNIFTGSGTEIAILITGNCTLNMTGQNTFTGSSGNTAIVIQSAATLNYTGTLNGGGSYGIQSTGASLINIIGPIVAGVVVAGTLGSPALNTTNGSSVTILTGPFISHSSGIQPFLVTRMHYRRTLGSYYEFRDNSTNGALPPSPPAPATRLVSPDTVVDAPSPNNVRQGVVYASGSQTGTMIVPSPSNVANNVPVDNTIGTAILNADNLWAINTSTMNTPNSIGQRLKNAATVQSVGDQLSASL